MSQEKKTTLMRYRNPLAAPLLIVAFVAASTAWIVIDQKVWPWDTAWYAEVTVDLWFALGQGIGAWTNAMLQAIGSKPPLLTWLAQFAIPLTRTGIEEETSLLFLIVALATATLYSIYRLASAVGASSTSAAAAIALCAGAPLFVAMSHQFLVEQLQALVVVGMLALAVKAPRQPVARTAALCVTMIALGALTKTTTALFLLPLLGYIVIVLVARTPKVAPGRLDLSLAILLATGAICAAAGWYVSNWPALVQHFKNATVGDVALNYGSAVVLPAKLMFWTTALSNSIAPTAIIAVPILLIIAAAFCVTLYRIGRRPWSDLLAEFIEQRVLLALTLLAIVLATLLAYSLQINEDPRFLLPLLPLMAVLLAWALFTLRNRILAATAALVLTANALATHAFSLGFIPGPFISWLMPAENSTIDKTRLAAVVRNTCPDRPNRYTIIGVEYVEFNANAANFYSAKQRRIRGFRCFYTTFGHAETSMEATLRQLSRVDPDYVVTVEPSKQRAPDFLNVVSKPAAEWLARDPRHARANEGADDYVAIFRRLP